MGRGSPSLSPVLPRTGPTQSPFGLKSNSGRGNALRCTPWRGISSRLRQACDVALGGASAAARLVWVGSMICRPMPVQPWPRASCKTMHRRPMLVKRAAALCRRPTSHFRQLEHPPGSLVQARFELHTGNRSSDPPPATMTDKKPLLSGNVKEAADRADAAELAFFESVSQTE